MPGTLKVYVQSLDARLGRLQYFRDYFHKISVLAPKPFLTAKILILQGLEHHIPAFHTNRALNSCHLVPALNSEVHAPRPSALELSAKYPVLGSSPFAPGLGSRLYPTGK